MSENLQTVRRSAKRRRAFAACVRCKTSKIQCSDFRPCKRCADSGNGGSCTDQTETNRTHYQSRKIHCIGNSASIPHHSNAQDGPAIHEAQQEVPFPSVTSFHTQPSVHYQRGSFQRDCNSVEPISNPTMFHSAAQVPDWHSMHRQNGAQQNGSVLALASNGVFQPFPQSPASFSFACMSPSGFSGPTQPPVLQSNLISARSWTGFPPPSAVPPHPSRPAFLQALPSSLHYGSDGFPAMPSPALLASHYLQLPFTLPFVPPMPLPGLPTTTLLRPGDHVDDDRLRLHLALAASGPSPAAAAAQLSRRWP